MNYVYLVFGADSEDETPDGDRFVEPTFEKAFSTRGAAQAWVSEVTDKEKFPTLYYYVNTVVVED